LKSISISIRIAVTLLVAAPPLNSERKNRPGETGFPRSAHPVSPTNEPRSASDKTTDFIELFAL